MASGSLATEELDNYYSLVIEPRFKLFRLMGRSGKVMPGSPYYERLEKNSPSVLHHVLDGAIEMELATEVAYIGLLALRRADETAFEAGISVYDSVWQRASDYLGGQQG